MSISNVKGKTMPKKSLANISHTESVSLMDLMGILGSPKKAQDGLWEFLTELDKSSQRNEKALKDLEKAEAERNAAAAADNDLRVKEAGAIHRDKEALRAAWEGFEKASADHESSYREKHKALKDREAVFATKNKAFENQQDILAANAAAMQRDHEAAMDDARALKADADEEFKAAAHARKTAKKLDNEANDKMREMRKLVA